MTEYISQDTVKHLAAKRLAALGMLQQAGTCADEWMERGHISSGSYARVYPLGDKLVVKVTRDESDARAAEHVRKLQDRGGGRNMVRVHYVCTLYRHPTEAWNAYYMLVNERVDEIPNRDVYCACEYYSMLGILGGSDVVAGAARRARGEHFSTAYSEKLSTDWGRAAALNVAGVANDLVAAGITGYTDWHHKNVMYRWEGAGGRVVLVDFGCSSSPHVAFEADEPLAIAA